MKDSTSSTNDDEGHVADEYGRHVDGPDDTQAHAVRVRFLEDAGSDDVQGHGAKWIIRDGADDDTEGSLYKRGVQDAGADDVEGHGARWGGVEDAGRAADAEGHVLRAGKVEDAAASGSRSGDPLSSDDDAEAHIARPGR